MSTTRPPSPRRHRSEEDLIREAVDRLLAEEPPRPLPRLPLFTNVDHTLADRADELADRPAVTRR